MLPAFLGFTINPVDPVVPAVQTSYTPPTANNITPIFVSATPSYNVPTGNNITINWITE